MSDKVELPISCIVKGIQWSLYTFQFKTPDGEFCGYFHAISDEHAAALQRGERNGGAKRANGRGRVMTTGKYELVIKWPSGQSIICGEMTDHQHGEICRILSPDYRAHPADQVADDLTMVKVPRDPDQNVFDFIEVAYEAAAPGDEGRDVWAAIINFYHPPITGQKAASSQDQRDIYEDSIKAISALLNGGRS